MYVCVLLFVCSIFTDDVFLPLLQSYSTLSCDHGLQCIVEMNQCENNNVLSTKSTTYTLYDKQNRRNTQKIWKQRETILNEEGQTRDYYYSTRLISSLPSGDLQTLETNKLKRQRHYISESFIGVRLTLTLNRVRIIFIGEFFFPYFPRLFRPVFNFLYSPDFFFQINIYIYIYICDI